MAREFLSAPRPHDGPSRLMPAPGEPARSPTGRRGPSFVAPPVLDPDYFAPIAPIGSAGEIAADEAAARRPVRPLDTAGVNVHADDAADRQARALGARAFTRGADIYFSRDAWHPGTTSTYAVLAHELHHARHGDPAVTWRWPNEGGGADAPAALSEADALQALVDLAFTTNTSAQPDVEAIVDELMAVLRSVGTSDPLTRLRLLQKIDGAFPGPVVTGLLARLEKEPLDPVTAAPPMPQYPPPLAGGRLPGLVLMPLAHEVGKAGQELWNLGYEGTKNVIIDGYIDLVHGARTQAMAHLEEATLGLPPSLQPAVQAALSVLDGLGELFEFSLLFQIGVSVGFVEGLASMVWGLVRLLGEIEMALLLFLYGFVDRGAAFDAYAEERIDALLALPDAVSQFIDDWLVRFQESRGEKRAFMLGEVVGELGAIIGAGLLTGGAAPEVALEVRLLETVARADGTLALGVATSTVDVGSGVGAAAGWGGSAAGHLPENAMAATQGNADWEPPRDGGSPADSRLPRYVRGQKTRGILEGVGGPTKLQSGTAGPGAPFASLAGLSEEARVALKHVEGHAAALMRAKKVETASLTINYVGGPCESFCVVGVGEILRPGQRLWVQYPQYGGRVGLGYFEGGSAGFTRID